VLTTNVFDTRKRQKEAEIASQFIYDLSGDFSVAFSQKKPIQALFKCSSKKHWENGCKQQT
jgi:hypothetical protein